MVEERKKMDDRRNAWEIEANVDPPRKSSPGWGHQSWGKWREAHDGQEGDKVMTQRSREEAENTGIWYTAREESGDAEAGTR